MSTSVTDQQLARIPGWFFPPDWRLFEFGLEESARQVGGGDLAEVGAYLGKSAVLIGAARRPEEQFTVIDLFGADPADSGNAAEVSKEYPTLTRNEFEENYLAVHDELPVVVQALSSELPRHAPLGAHRFVHVDGSHRYDVVAEDIRIARTLLAPQGLVVFDDYRTFHTPGVAAAVWGAVLRDGLHPLWMSDVKLYATWGDPEPWLDALRSWLPMSDFVDETQTIAGNEVYRLSSGKRLRRQIVSAEMRKAAAQRKLLRWITR